MQEAEKQIQTQKKPCQETETIMFLCVFEGEEKSINISGDSRFAISPYDAAVTCSFKGVRGLWATFLMNSVSFYLLFSCNPLMWPLLIFCGGKKHSVSAEHWVQRDITAIDVGSFCRGSSSRPRRCGRRWESLYESCNLSYTSCREQKERSRFPLQQSSVAPRLSPTALLHDCSCHRMVRCLSGETEALPDHQ